MTLRLASVIAGVLVAALAVAPAAQERPAGQGFSFRSNVSLINVTVTVTDANGRFVGTLKESDFDILEDGRPQAITHFSAERVPVSLGLTIDTSGSMAGDKWIAAQGAVRRFVDDLLRPDDEVFLSRFDSRPQLVHPWTRERRAIGDAFARLQPRGGTALYDAVSDAVPVVQQGSHRKKALVVISDGLDTDSSTAVDDLTRTIRESEVLVYAIGIDASGQTPTGSQGSRSSTTPPSPSPFPGRPRPSAPTASSSPSSRPAGGNTGRVNADALRVFTDDSGGRTEIIYSARDLDPATAGIASELSQQYFLAYASSAPKDGRWHAIDVRIKGRSGPYIVRARRGFIAS
jgi:VWFA-related protein